MVSLRRKAVYLTFLALLAFTIATVITVSLHLKQVAVSYPGPQAILMLGGSTDREIFTSQLAQIHPDYDIWVSSGTSEAAQIFDSYNISPNRIHISNQATDTVTNFTTTVSPLKAQGIRHVYLVTSDYHMPRARAIGTIIFGFHGIIFTPIEVPSQAPPEPKLIILRDIIRSLVWLLTGWSGAAERP